MLAPEAAKPFLADLLPFEKKCRDVQAGLGCSHIQVVGEGSPGEDSRHRSWLDRQRIHDTSDEKAFLRFCKEYL